MKSNGERPEGAEEPGAWTNIGKIVLLVVILVVAWFVLDRVIGGK